MKLIKFFRLLAIFSGALYLASCATYKEDWIAPTTPQGLQCVAQCSGIKQSCEISQQALNQQCQASYQKAVSDFQNCKAMNPATSYCSSYRTKTETVNGKTVTREECTSTRYESPCKEPRNTCSTTPNTSSCDANYKICFQGCGGTINRYEVK